MFIQRHLRGVGFGFLERVCRSIFQVDVDVVPYKNRLLSLAEDVLELARRRQVSRCGGPRSTLLRDSHFPPGRHVSCSVSRETVCLEVPGRPIVWSSLGRPTRDHQDKPLSSPGRQTDLPRSTQDRLQGVRRTHSFRNLSVVSRETGSYVPLKNEKPELGPRTTPRGI